MATGSVPPAPVHRAWAVADEDRSHHAAIRRSCGGPRGSRIFDDGDVSAQPWGDGGIPFGCNRRQTVPATHVARTTPAVPSPCGKELAVSLAEMRGIVQECLVAFADSELVPRLRAAVGAEFRDVLSSAVGTVKAAASEAAVQRTAAVRKSACRSGDVAFAESKVPNEVAIASTADVAIDDAVAEALTIAALSESVIKRVSAEVATPLGKSACDEGRNCDIDEKQTAKTVERESESKLTTAESQLTPFLGTLPHLLPAPRRSNDFGLRSRRGLRTSLHDKEGSLGSRGKVARVRTFVASLGAGGARGMDASGCKGTWGSPAAAPCITTLRSSTEPRSDALRPSGNGRHTLARRNSCGSVLLAMQGSCDDTGRGAGRNGSRRRCFLQALHPDGGPRKMWNKLMLGVFFCDFVWVTFEWAFLPILVADTGLPRIVGAIGSLACGFAVVDICLNLCTGYLDMETCMMQLSLRRAAARYARTWLCLDAVATAPSILEQALLVTIDVHGFDNMTWVSTLTRALKSARLLRVLKMASLQQRVARSDAGTHSRTAMAILCLAQILTVLFVTAHTGACMLWFVGCMVNGGGASDIGQQSWIASAGPDGGSLTHSSVSLGQQYAGAMYLSLSILTSLGMGHFSTTSAMEQCVFSAYALSALLFMSVLINEVASVYAKVNNCGATTRRAIAEASGLMDWYQVPKELQMRIERFLQATLEHKEQLDVRSRMNEWLQASSGLLEELNVAVFGRCLLTHPQLRFLPAEPLPFIADLCQAVFLPPGEVVSHPTSIPTRMLAVRSGSLELVAAAKGGNSLGCGDPACSGLEYRNGDSLDSGACQLSSCSSLFWSTDDRRSKSTRTSKLGVGDILFHQHLLFPQLETSRCTCACTTFCEVIVLEFEPFCNLMTRRYPAVLKDLRLLAAVADDSPVKLAWTLGDVATLCSDPCLGLGHGDTSCGDETLFHECARAGAIACITWLLDSLYPAQTAIFDRKGAYGMTPLELAKIGGHKATVDALLVHGFKSGEMVSTGLAGDGRGTGEWEPLRRARCLDGVFTASAAAITYEELTSRFHEVGLDLSAFGVNGAKTLLDLFEEVSRGMSVCIVDTDGRLKRLTCVLRLRVEACCSDGTSRVLSETENQEWLSLAHSHVARLPAKQMKPDATGMDKAIDQLWRDNLGLSPAFANEHFERGIESVYEEEKESATYPGLPCRYIVHEVPFWPREPMSGDVFKQIGLPEGSSFKTFGPRVGQEKKRRTFIWLDIPRPRPIVEVAESFGAYLRTKGVDVTPWGVNGELELCREMQDGLCSCMEDTDGQLVRLSHVARLRVDTVVEATPAVALVRSATSHAVICSGSEAALSEAALPVQNACGFARRKTLERVVRGGRIEAVFAELRDQAAKLSVASDCEVENLVPCGSEQGADAGDVRVQLEGGERGESADWEISADVYVAEKAAARFPGLRCVTIVHDV